MSDFRCSACEVMFDEHVGGPIAGLCAACAEDRIVELERFEDAFMWLWKQPEWASARKLGQGILDVKSGARKFEDVFPGLDEEAPK